jgi:hypothetical protein
VIRTDYPRQEASQPKREETDITMATSNSGFRGNPAWNRVRGGLAAALWLTGWGVVEARAQGALDGAGQALFAPTEVEGWSIGLRFAALSRELKVEGRDLLELDAHRVVAEVGRDLTPAVQLALQAGWTQAEAEDQDGENGPAWAVLGRANLAETVLRASPEIGRQEWAGLEVEAGYRYGASNFDEADFDWSEVYVAPAAYYRVNHRGDARRKSYHGTGYGIRLGLVFNAIDGDYGSASVDENRNFGFLAAADVRWWRGWSGQLMTHLYGSGDQTIEAGIHYHF